MGQSDLTEFLAVSGDLEVKGLTPDGGEVAAATSPPTEPSDPAPSLPPAKRKKVAPNLLVRQDLGPSLSSEQEENDAAVVKMEKVQNGRH